MKVLHLASWFPNETDPFNGDFIQRQLKALSLFRNVTVIAIVKDLSMKAGQTRVVHQRLHESYEEWIVYYGSSETGISFIDRFLSFRQYRMLFLKQVGEYIRSVGKPDLLHVHVAMNAGPVAQILSKRLGISYVVTEHSSIYQRTAKENLWNRSFIWRSLNKKVIRGASALFPVSAHLGKLVSEWVPVRSVKVIPNVVDTALFFYRPLQDKMPFRFLHVSGMNEPKNVEGLLRAMSIFRAVRTDWTIKMVGPASDALKQMAIELQIDHLVEWTGELPYAAVAAQMQQCHAHVLFSRYENQPCVNLEAFCCGLPVIATDVGGIREVVNDNNGILIPALDEHALSDAMGRMMDTYARYDRQRISDEARDLFGYQVVGKMIDEQYRFLTS